MGWIWVVMVLLTAGYGVMSVVAFAAFWWDKRLAKMGARRLQERTLHVLSGLGGFAGSLAAMYVVRHKNRKPVFVVVTWGIAAGHMLLIGVMLAIGALAG